LLSKICSGVQIHIISFAGRGGVATQVIASMEVWQESCFCMSEKDFLFLGAEQLQSSRFLSNRVELYRICSDT